jgi:1-deoxy-D-xylulose-5-phosphate synthase
LVDHATPDQSKASLGLMPSQMAERILTKFFSKKLATVSA